uniref:Uncharacterized protein n=1 Tax=Megaselia scalaris TaxID=36166 RepID=T1GK14_MEGSC
MKNHEGMGDPRKHLQYGKLGNLLGNPEDKIPDMMKAGIYSIGCDSVSRFILSRCAIERRIKKHRCFWINGRAEKSDVAKHLLEENHGMDLSSVKLMKEVQQVYLNESLYICRNKNNMNTEDGPIFSPFSTITGLCPCY